jgi:hypothetical protein
MLRTPALVLGNSCRHGGIHALRPFASTCCVLLEASTMLVVPQHGCYSLHTAFMHRHQHIRQHDACNAPATHTGILCSTCLVPVNTSPHRTLHV